MYGHPGQPPPPGQYGAPPGHYGAPPPGHYGPPPRGQYGAPPGPYPAPSGYPAPAGSFAGAPGSSFNPTSAQLHGFGGQYYQQLDQMKLAELRSWFNGIDADRSGQISSLELRRAQFAGRNLNPATCANLLKIFDTDGSGQLGFFEFAALHQFVTSAITSFYMFDADGSGKLSQREVQQALNQAGFVFMESTIDVLYKKFQSLKLAGTLGQLSIDDYLNLTAFLGQIRSTFFAQDTDRDGIVQFTLESLVQLVSRF